MSGLSGHLRATTLVICFDVNSYVNVRMILWAFVMGDFIGPFLAYFRSVSGVVDGPLVWVDPRLYGVGFGWDGCGGCPWRRAGDRRCRRGACRG